MKKFGELIECNENVLPIFEEIAPDLIEHISPAKWKRIEKKVLLTITAKQIEAFEQELLNGGGIDFPKVCGVYTSSSKVRTTEAGVAVRKVSVRTRERMKRKYNN